MGASQSNSPGRKRTHSQQVESTNRQKQQPLDMIDMKIRLNMIIRSLRKQSGKADKESKKEMAEAKRYLERNKEEQAKLHLQQAASKDLASKQLLKQSLNIEQIQMRLDDIYKKKQMQEIYRDVGGLLAHKNLDIYEAMRNKENFEKVCDNFYVEGKLIEQLMSTQRGFEGGELEANMLEALRQEMHMEQQNRLDAVMGKDRQDNKDTMKSTH